MTEDTPTFFFFHFQRTGSEISVTRCGALLLDLCQQRTTKAMGNARRLHLQTLSLALALVRRLQCEHLFFLQLMGIHPHSGKYWESRNLPLTLDTRLPCEHLFFLRLMGTHPHSGKYWESRNLPLTPATRFPN